VKVRFNPKAKADLQSATRFIAADSTKSARRWAASIRENCAKLGGTPGLGVPKPELGPDVRMLVVGSYLVFYEAGTKGVEILRIMYGARDWQEILSPEAFRN
jgi:toxin ParE1/3/4